MHAAIFVIRGEAGAQMKNAVAAGDFVVRGPTVGKMVAAVDRTDDCTVRLEHIEAGRKVSTTTLQIFVDVCELSHKLCARNLLPN